MTDDNGQLLTIILADLVWLSTFLTREIDMSGTLGVQ